MVPNCAKHHIYTKLNYSPEKHANQIDLVIPNIESEHQHRIFWYLNLSAERSFTAVRKNEIF